MSMTEAQNRTKNAPKVSLIKRGYRFILESLGLITALGFLISISINTITFSLNWHLSYLEIASTTDVVMSSFRAVGTFIGLIFTVLVLFSAPNFISGRIIRFLRRFNRVGRIIGMLSITLLCIGLVTADWLGYMPKPAPVDPMVSNRRLTEASALFDKCGNAYVLWSGSDSAILNCHGDAWVTSHVDGIIWKRVK